MIKQLHISNYALISKLDIGFADGLTIITGETGAGNITLRNALAIASALGVDPAELMPGKQVQVASIQREAGEAEPESRRYKKDIECQKCGNSMSFPEWEQHRFRCPICGEQA